MGGDLNLKKSWHPHLRKNQEKVWKEEKAALEERKLIEKLRKEREEERAIEELQKLQEANGGKVRQQRVDWMYNGTDSGGAGVSEEMEGYLLGKRRVDQLLKRSAETEALQKGAAASIDTVAAPIHDTVRDAAKKVAGDPLLEIKKRQMEAQLKAMREAQKMQKASKKDEERRSRRHGEDRDRDRSHKHRHRHHGDRSDSRDRRHHDRSRSRDRRRRDRSSSRDRRHDRSDSRDYRRRDRSRSKDRRQNEKTDRQRSRSPYCEGRDRTRRERSPPRRSYDARRRSRSPRRRYSDDDKPHRYSEERSRHLEEQKPQEDAAAKLAAMQADAKSLDEQRNERVRLRELEDAAEATRNSSKGGQRFGNTLRRAAIGL